MMRSERANLKSETSRLSLSVPNQLALKNKEAVMNNTSAQTAKVPAKVQVLSLNIQKTDAKSVGIAAAGLCFNKA